jgi:DNA-binding HxlR family transcriptional regulator
MLGRTYESQVCSISRTLEVFGERWTFLIMRNALFADSVHFVDFQRSLGIATNILTARLEHLIASGVMEKDTTDAGGSTGYRLTKRGRELAPALIALTEWGDDWAAPEGEPVLYRHHAGEHPVHVRVVCDICGPLDELDDIETLPGPGMPQVLAERLLQRHNARHAD